MQRTCNSFTLNTSNFINNMPVISVKAEPAIIKASGKDVWERLTDISTWSSWNSFVPEAEILDAQDAQPSSGPRTLALGNRIRFQVNMNGNIQKSDQKVIVYEVPAAGDEKKAWKICWAYQDLPDFLLRSCRWNEIEQTGENECIYRTGEEMYGPVAYVVKALHGKAVDQGIKNWAEGLQRSFISASP
ncbi:hypothetical protein BS50DRAFT_236543 [Corynespora cassiicola Philippines]|uniref:Bet v1-like protein n=1 Tax=Corynespora cassiicola Philippines TaxID=1448308 RepID=A0A2T2P2D6_CORCC|nr:hypothetical protein BS50DRAFT_236543 [Corynespora cassiicola Philippines]